MALYRLNFSKKTAFLPKIIINLNNQNVVFRGSRTISRFVSTEGKRKGNH